MVLIRHKAFWLLFQFSDFTSSTNENERLLAVIRLSFGYRRYMFNEHFDISQLFPQGLFPS
jgi:hypothetical protein